MRSDSKNTKAEASKENNILENFSDATDDVDGSPTSTDKNQSSFQESYIAHKTLENLLAKTLWFRH